MQRILLITKVTGSGQALAWPPLSRQAAQQRRGAADCGEYRQAAGAVAEELASLFRFHIHQRHSAFLAFVDAKCRKRTYSRHVFD
jgi:hypothetical protein